MKKRTTLFCIGLLLITITFSCSKNQKSTHQYQLELQKGIDLGYPGMIVGIEKKRSSWIGSEGLANIEQQVKMKTDDRFHIASVTKIFTAVAVLQLIDTGKLQLDDKAIRFLDSSLVSAIPYINEIKISQLLDHSSGIYSFNNDLEYIDTIIGKGAFDNKNWSNEQLISLAYGDRVEPQGKPESGHFYADTNYILLGLIIEKVTEKSFRQIIKEQILDPLELNNTGFYGSNKNDDDIELPLTVQGYLKRSEDLDAFITIHRSYKKTTNGLVNTTNAVEKIDASAGMVGTVRDLLTFGTALYKGDLLSSKSLKWLLSIGKDIEKEDLDTRRQGLVTVKNQPYGVLYTSLGDGPAGINTMLGYHPKSDAVIVAFTNVFGNFNEHDFFMDELIPSLLNYSNKDN